MKVGRKSSGISFIRGLKMNDIICGVGTFATTLVVAQEHTSDPWISILVAVISAVIYAVINLGTRIITSVLEKKGLISSEDKKKIDDVAEDISDDGKINNSNKEDKNK